MMQNPLAQSILTFLIRRGLSVLGAAGASVSEEWVAQTVNLLLMAGNEVYQWWQAHKAEKQKAEIVKGIL